MPETEPEIPPNRRNKRLALGAIATLLTGVVSWVATNSDDLNKIISFLPGTPPVASPLQEGITKDLRNFKLAELRRKIGAVSVGLFKLNGDNLEYVIDLDDLADIYIREIDSYTYVDIFNALDALDCYGVETEELQLADVASVINPKQTSLKKGEQLYAIACPTYYIESGYQQKFDGAIVAVFKYKIKDRIALRKITKTLWLESTSIKPPYKNGFDFR
jgi:hypothetical protein